MAYIGRERDSLLYISINISAGKTRFDARARLLAPNVKPVTGYY